MIFAVDVKIMITKINHWLLILAFLVTLGETNGQTSTREPKRLHSDIVSNSTNQISLDNLRLARTIHPLSVISTSAVVSIIPMRRLLAVEKSDEQYVKEPLLSSTLHNLSTVQTSLGWDGQTTSLPTTTSLSTNIVSASKTARTTINNSINTDDLTNNNDSYYMEQNNSIYNTLNEDTMTTMSDYNQTCNEFEDENCYIDHNVTCVGDKQYCNLTYDEYIELLTEYIYPTFCEWILIASHTVVFVVGLVGNALVCIAVYNPTMRTVTNIFIVNLAVADFFVILFCLPPTVVWDVTETWFMGKAMCKVIIYFQTISVTVSVLTLTFISIDRWYAICFPLRYKPRPERAWRSIAVIWIIGILFDLPEFLVLTTKHSNLRFGITLFTQCVTTWDKETEKQYYIIKAVGLYTFPLFLMSIAYFQIVKVLWRSDTIPGHRESRNHPNCRLQNTRTTLNCSSNPSTMGQLRARRKAAKMLVCVVIMFAACYFPVHALNIARQIWEINQNDVISVLSLFSHWLCYANSAVNPVIYNFMSGKFRREFKHALEKCKCLRKQNSSNGRVGGYDDRSMYHHTTTRMHISPSTRSNYQLTSVRDVTGAHVRKNVHQTSFNGNNTSNTNGNSLTAPTVVPEERMALTKNDGGT